MKIKKALMCGAMAAVMMFTGCGKGQTVGGNDKLDKVNADFNANVRDVAPKSGNLIATFEIEDYGTIKAVLFPEVAPVGVDNFRKLCDAGFYKGLNIHRVIEDFMFQGGSTNGNGTGGEAMVNGGKFSIETAQNARHFYGALCYANAGADNNSTQFYIVNSKTAQDLGELAETAKANADYFKEAVDYYQEQGVEEAVAYYGEKQTYYQNMHDMAASADDAIKERYKEKGGTPSLDGNYTVFGQVYEGFDVIDAISAANVMDNGAGEFSKPVKDMIIKDISVSTFE